MIKPYHTKLQNVKFLIFYISSSLYKQLVMFDVIVFLLALSCYFVI